MSKRQIEYAKREAKRERRDARGLSIVLIAISLLICTAASMRIERNIVRDRVESAPEMFVHRIDLNTACEAELQLLPQIGPRLAERIVEDREMNGAFASLGDLARVRGIGRATIERIEPFVIVSPAEALAVVEP